MHPLGSSAYRATWIRRDPLYGTVPIQEGFNPTIVESSSASTTCLSTRSSTERGTESNLFTSRQCGKWVEPSEQVGGALGRVRRRAHA